MLGMRASLIALCTSGLVSTPAWADTFAQRGPTEQGRVQFVLVGASMVDNQGLTNGVNCLWPSATATVSAADLPARPRLVRATLYVAGSLIADDGLDYVDPPLEIFVTPGLQADDPAELVQVEAAARAAADTSVELRPPGASAPVTVTAPAGSSYVSVYYKPSGAEQGNVGFFVTPIDVTEAILGAGGGVLIGAYTVSGLLADVCNGPEAVCGAPPAAPTCATVAGSAVHTNGAASFALLLVVDDPELRLHAIATFEGLQALAGGQLQLGLETANAISDPAAGSLAFYALEGDILIPTAVNPTGPCNAEEYIEVDGDTNPTQNGLCLTDDDNPLGNLFNSTINVQPAAGPPPVCIDAPHQCCNGDGLCPVTGVDIDRFDISAALTPGGRDVRVAVASGTDRIALALVVLGVDVYEPVLRQDTQVRVIALDGERVVPADDGVVRLAEPVLYSIAVSNTGNVPASGVSVRFSAPPRTRSATLLLAPGGATSTTLATGGDAGTGEILVTGFAVPAGEIAEVRVQVTPTCDAAGRPMAPTVEVGSAELALFAVAAPAVTPRGPAPEGLCPGVDPDGPFAIVPPDRNLRGGGCAAVSPAALALALVLLLGRRRLAALALVVALGAGCGERRPPPDEPPVDPPRNLTSLAGLPGEPCGSPLRVWVSLADASRFCIDRFEARLDGGALGDAHQGADDLDLGTNGSTQARALVALGVAPTAGLSWYQAKAACANAGKRLCRRDEWERACRGPAAWIYPYGDQIRDDACQGFFAYPVHKPEVTGSLASCVSPFGVYDLSGNLEEWVDEAVPRLPGTTPLVDRTIRGGSFKSNANALACLGDEFHAPPGTTDVDRGVRCCSDGPVD